MDLAGVLSYIAEQAAGVLLFSLLGARILMWRAVRLRGWKIRYGTAWRVSIEAGLVSLAFGNAAALIAFFLGGIEIAGYVGTPFTVIAWWAMHARLLSGLSEPPDLPAATEPANLTASVFGFAFPVALVIAIGVVSVTVMLR